MTAAVIACDGAMGRWAPDGTGRLEQAALDLFSEVGYEQTTVKQTAEQAGLTERTFFRHSSDKREVLFPQSQPWRRLSSLPCARSTRSRVLGGGMAEVVTCVDVVEQGRVSGLPAEKLACPLTGGGLVDDRGSFPGIRSAAAPWARRAHPGAGRWPRRCPGCLLQGQPERAGGVQPVHRRPAAAAVADMAGDTRPAGHVDQVRDEAVVALAVVRPRRPYDRGPHALVREAHRRPVGGGACGGSVLLQRDIEIGPDSVALGCDVPGTTGVPPVTTNGLPDPAKARARRREGGGAARPGGGLRLGGPDAPRRRSALVTMLASCRKPAVSGAAPEGCCTAPRPAEVVHGLQG